METDPRLGQVILGKLEVLRCIGGGGMGQVYEVRHQLTGHHRALKIVPPKYASRPRFVHRLMREAGVAGRLRSPHVVETFDAGRLDDGSAYLLMELLEGGSMYDAMKKRCPMPAAQVLPIVEQVTEGMAVAHASGIVHRDLKPENIFLLSDPPGRVKILDFGVSKYLDDGDGEPQRVTSEGAMIGTPYYMAPEQAASREVDARVDVYALGVLMYEALSGRLPFEAQSISELLIRIGAGTFIPLRRRRPDLDPELTTIIERAFHRDAASRFDDAAALGEALRPFLGRDDLEDRNPSTAEGESLSTAWGEITGRYRRVQGVGPTAGRFLPTAAKVDPPETTSAPELQVPETSETRLPEPERVAGWRVLVPVGLFSAAFGAAAVGIALQTPLLGPSAAPVEVIRSPARALAPATITPTAVPEPPANIPEVAHAVPPVEVATGRPASVDVPPRATAQRSSRPRRAARPRDIELELGTSMPTVRRPTRPAAGLDPNPYR